jgi:hypothetical protein
MPTRYVLAAAAVIIVVAPAKTDFLAKLANDFGAA